jgi:hypothetical protein
MRVIVATCAGLIALSTISVQAGPLPPSKDRASRAPVSFFLQGKRVSLETT